MTMTLVLGVGVTSSGASSSSWPKTIKAHAFYVAGNPKPLAFGTVVTAAMLKRDGGSITSRSYVGNVGWALGGANGFQYPFVSSDHGKIWRIGGHYFGGPWADACAFVDHMSAITASVVVAWGNCPGNLYVTWSGGHQWNGVPVPGNLLTIKGTSNSGQVVLTARVSTYTDPKEHPLAVNYVSDDDGQSWFLSSNG